MVFGEVKGANRQLIRFCLTFGFGPFRADFWPSIGNAMAFSGQRSVDRAGLTGSRRSWLTCRTVQQSTQSSKFVTNSSRFGWMQAKSWWMIESFRSLKHGIFWNGLRHVELVLWNIVSWCLLKNGPCRLKLDKLVRKWGRFHATGNQCQSFSQPNIQDPIARAKEPTWVFHMNIRKSQRIGSLPDNMTHSCFDSAAGERCWCQDDEARHSMVGIAWSCRMQ